MDCDTVYLAGKPYTVEDARVQKTCVLMKLAGVDSVEAAARLREWAETVLDWAHHKKFDPLMKLRGRRRRTGLGGV